MGAPKNKGYKRSWKNLLLNKQYQLSFTLLMVGLSAILMAALGYWVNREATRATEIFLNDVKDCRIPPPAVAPPVERERGDVDLDIGEMKMVAPTPPPAPDGTVPAADATAPGTIPGATPAPAEGEAPPAEIQPSTPEPTVAAPVAPPANSASASAEERASWPVNPVCQKTQAAKRQELLDGQRFILFVLIGVGLLLLLGLTAFGIKMTHKVAGPLFKVSLYFDKMRDEKYDTVWNLRKGDQLVDFYEHFKGGHAGVKKMQAEDLERLKAIIAAAKEAKLADRSPEVAAALAKLEEIAKRKEDSLV